MSFDPAKPYNDLPLLPPKADIETRAILKACIEARAALAELKQAGELIPNQAVLINSIPLLEAQASSEIENIVRQATGVAKAPQVAAFVKGLMDQGEKVVLFGWHRAVYDIWLEQLKEYNPVMYTGSESPGQKEAARDRFIRGESKLMIVSLRSGIGLDGLQYVANTCVFGELDWSPEVHKQCIGRVHRDGREAGSTVMAYFLVSDSGLDPIMSEVLGLKDEQSTWLMDGAPTAITQRVDDKIIKRVAEKYAKGVT
jgi:SNF2 family DNA or RNA helicase